MSKIETYNKQKAIASSMRNAMNLSLGKHADGRPNQNNDKHTASCRFVRISDDQFSPILLRVELSHGYYGSSSGYSNTSKEMGMYLAKAIDRYMPMLLEEACSLADKDAEAARIAAISEARSILSVVDEASEGEV